MADDLLQEALAEAIHGTEPDGWCYCNTWPCRDGGGGVERAAARRALEALTAQGAVVVVKVKCDECGGWQAVTPKDAIRQCPDCRDGWRIEIKRVDMAWSPQSEGSPRYRVFVEVEGEKP